MVEQLIEHFKFGGVLSTEDPTYVEREADVLLYEALKAGKFCYVLESRQTGKSSLCFRTREKLNKKQIENVYIDLLGIDIDYANLSSWYQDQMDTISTQLELEIDITQWAKQNAGLSPLKIYDKFIEEVLLEQKKQNIVIFIDEIDSVLSLPFSTDDFFAFIKSCDNKRGDNPKYQRLTFCLLGVASPNNLIKNKQRTPFNVAAKAIPLKPFKLEDVGKLIEVLGTKYNSPRKVMAEILYWTGGQPYLTQKLCQLMIEEFAKENPNSVEQVVRSHLIEDWENEDDQVHFTTIQDRLLGINKERIDENLAFRLLTLYQKVLSESINANDHEDQIELKLTGIVLQEDRKLKVYNPIYEHIFNTSWIQEQKAKLRFYAVDMEKWHEAKDEKNGLEELYLLYGFRFEEAWKAKTKKEDEEGVELGGTEVNFLHASQEFWKDAKKSLPDGSDCEEVIKVIIDWTGGLKTFNHFIFSISKKYRKKSNSAPPEKGKEEKWIEELLRTHLFDKFENLEKPIEDENVIKHLQKIEAEFVNYINPSSLLTCYQEILKQEEVEFNKSPEHQKLIDMCLVIKEENKLRILNKIYRFLLDQEWITKLLSSLCPYHKAFQSWKDSGYQNESYLLQGEDLQEALDWIQNKPDFNNESELEFIITSLVWEMWTNVSPQEKTEAVAIIQEKLPDLRKKQNYSYGLLQEVLKYTSSDSLLLADIIQLIIQNDSSVEDIEKFIKLKKKADQLMTYLKNKLIKETDNGYGIDSIFLLHINSKYILSSYLLEDDSQLLNFNNLIEIGRQNIKNLLDETQTLTERLSIKHINLFTQDKIIYFVVLPEEILICIVVDLQKDPLELNIQKFIKDNQYEFTNLS